MLSNIFDVRDPIIIDIVILRYEYHGYELEAHTHLNTSGEIRIHVTNKDTFVHPAGNYLLIDERLKKADGTAYASGDKVTPVNNGTMFMFDSIKGQLSKKNIDEVQQHRG